MHSKFLLAFAGIVTSARAEATITQLFNFSSFVDIENSFLRPNGNLLLTTFDAGRLYNIDLNATNPQAELVAALPGATALTGISAIGTDRYAISGGVRGANYSYANETVYTIQFNDGNDFNNITIDTVASLPDAILLNGLASLTANPNVLLIADSRVGTIWRVDIETGTVTQDAFTAASHWLTYTVNATTPLGVNGLKISEGFVYWTNTALRIFARVAISEDGYQAGDVEVIATLAAGLNFDDFNIDEANGVAYASLSQSAVAKITLADGSIDIVAGSIASSVMLGPTEVQVAEGGKTLYVTTRGATPLSGQVVRVDL